MNYPTISSHPLALAPTAGLIAKERADGYVGAYLVGANGETAWCDLVGDDFIRMDLHTKMLGQKFCSLDEAEIMRGASGMDY